MVTVTREGSVYHLCAPDRALPASPGGYSNYVWKIVNMTVKAEGLGKGSWNSVFPRVPKYQMLTSHRSQGRVTTQCPTHPGLRHRDLVSLCPVSFCQFHRTPRQLCALLTRPPPPPRSPKSSSVCSRLPITCTKSIRKHLSTPSLFTFKGLNSLFTGLSTNPSGFVW